MESNKYFLIISKNEMINLIKKNSKIRKLLNEQRDQYLILLSPSFKNKSLIQIIQEEKKYLLSLDDKAKIYYVICYINDEPLGICKFIHFHKSINHFDFFKILQEKYSIQNFIYIFGVYVKLSARNMHICSSLLNFVITYMKKYKIKYAISDIKESNTSSIRCFVKNKFNDTKLISRNDDVFFYILQL